MDLLSFSDDTNLFFYFVIVRNMSKRPDKQLYVPKHRRVQGGNNNDSKYETPSKNTEIVKKTKTKQVVSNSSEYVVYTQYNTTDDTEVKIESLKNSEHTAVLSDDILKVCDDSTKNKEKNSSNSDCVVTEINETSKNTASVVTSNNEIHSNVNFATNANIENVYNCESIYNLSESQTKISESFKSTFEQRGDILANEILNVSIQDLKHICKKEETYPRQMQLPTAHNSNEPLIKKEKGIRNLNIDKSKNFEKLGIDLASMIISDSMQIAKVQKIKDDTRMNSIKKFSQELATKIITKGLEKTKKHICRLRKPINRMPNPQFCLEITVDNFVNKAIENAIEILKAVRLYERKVESCHKKEIEVKKTVCIETFLKKTADQSETCMAYITGLTQTHGRKTNLSATIEKEISGHDSENIYLTKESPTSESATDIKIHHSETGKTVIEPDAGVTGDTERDNASQDTISIPFSLIKSINIDFKKHLSPEEKNVDPTENQKEDTVSNEDLTSVSIKSEANKEIEKVPKSSDVPKNLHLVGSLTDVSALKKTKSKNSSKKQKDASIGSSSTSGNTDSPKMKQKSRKPVKLKKIRGKQSIKEQNDTEIDATKKPRLKETSDISLVVGKVKEVNDENDHEDNDDWEKNFTEDGECINGDLLKEVKINLLEKTLFG